MQLSYAQVREALAGRRLPLAFVDLDAFDRNVARVAELVRPRSTPVRVASKSVRSTALLARILERGGPLFAGVLCYTVEEAEHLARAGFDDLIVAYPAFQACDLERAARLAAAGTRLALMADCREAIDRIGRFAGEAGARVDVVLCVDMSLELAGGRVHLGVRRSPLRQPEEVVALARHAAAAPGVRFHGIMGYEAQVAGLGDDSPFEPLQNPLKRWVRSASARELGARRAAIVSALAAAGLAPRLVNGGGSGSLDTTTPDTGVTEVTAGSAFFKPHLFDYYKSRHMRELEPACFFALEVTRQPARGLVTCLGGGYVASGAPGQDKVPRPWLPAGLSLLSAEMCGEVQTPLACPPGTLALGDPVVFRHAKAGELCEHFDELLLLTAGRVVGSAPTYRGQGKCFL